MLEHSESDCEKVGTWLAIIQNTTWQACNETERAAYKLEAWELLDFLSLFGWKSPQEVESLVEYTRGTAHGKGYGEGRIQSEEYWLKAVEQIRQEEREQILERLKQWRDLESVCPKCSGSGVRAYPSTSTWHGGIGGQMITGGVCDTCWGSGDDKRPWTDLRQLNSKVEQIKREAEQEGIRKVVKWIRKYYEGQILLDCPDGKAMRKAWGIEEK